jgi:hypothetical protein
MEKKVLLFAVGYLVLALMLSGVHVSYITRRDTYAVEKYTSSLVPVIYITGFVLFLLANYYVQAVDRTYFTHLVYGFVMLVCLPAVLFSVGVATIIGGNV